MTNEIKDLIQKFRERLIKDFSYSVNTEILSAVSNMLAFNYTQEQNDIDAYLERSVRNLNKYLKEKVYTSFDFSVAMSLFLVAIKAEDEDKERDSKSEEKAILNELLSDVEGQDIDNFKAFVADILKTEGGGKILNSLYSNKGKIKQIYEHYRKNVNISKNDIKNEILTILNLESNKSRVFNNIKQATSLLCTVLTGAAIATISSVSLGLIGPLMILPVTIGAMKVVSKPVDKITSKIIDAASEKFATSIIDEKIQALRSPNPKTKEIEKEHAVEALNILKKIKLEKAEVIRKDHTPEVISKAESLKNSINK